MEDKQLIELSKKLIEVLRSGQSVFFEYIDSHECIDVYVGTRDDERRMSDGNLIDPMPIGEAADVLTTGIDKAHKALMRLRKKPI